MWSNPIKTLEPLRGLPNLSYVALADTEVTDLSPLADVPKLNGFRADTDQLAKCSPKDMQEIKAGVSCYGPDGQLKRWFGL